MEKFVTEQLHCNKVSENGSEDGQPSIVDALDVCRAAAPVSPFRFSLVPTPHGCVLEGLAWFVTVTEVAQLPVDCARSQLRCQISGEVEREKDFCPRRFFSGLQTVIVGTRGGRRVALLLHGAGHWRR
jgi:hypothetical protein